MPLASAQTFEDILLKLSVLRYIFKSRSKLGKYDLNKQAERFFMNVLNRIEDLNLVDLNEENANAVAIDLGDKAEKICIQVTAENNSSKIHKTIKGFIKNKLYKHYDRLVILIITEKRNYSVDFDTKNMFTFSKESDIWDIDDLLEKIEKMEIAKSEDLKDYLSQELAPIVATYAQPNSILAKAEQTVHLPPKTADKFLKLFGFVPGEKYWDDEFESIHQFYKKLVKLSRKQREFLAFIVNRGNSEFAFGYDRIRIFPSELQNLLNLSAEDVFTYFQVLEDAGLAQSDPDDKPHKIELFFPTNAGNNLLPLLKDFCKTEVMVNKVLVDGDFTVLD